MFLKKREPRGFLDLWRFGIKVLKFFGRKRDSVEEEEFERQTKEVVQKIKKIFNKRDYPKIKSHIIFSICFI